MAIGPIGRATQSALGQRDYKTNLRMTLRANMMEEEQARVREEERQRAHAQLVYGELSKYVQTEQFQINGTPEQRAAFQARMDESGAVLELPPTPIPDLTPQMFAGDWFAVQQQRDLKGRVRVNFLKAKYGPLMTKLWTQHQNESAVSEAARSQGAEEAGQGKTVQAKEATALNAGSFDTRAGAGTQDGRPMSMEDEMAAALDSGYYDAPLTTDEMRDRVIEDWGEFQIELAKHPGSEGFLRKAAIEPAKMMVQLGWSPDVESAIEELLRTSEASAATQGTLSERIDSMRTMQLALSDLDEPSQKALIDAFLPEMKGTTITKQASPNTILSTMARFMVANKTMAGKLLDWATDYMGRLEAQQGVNGFDVATNPTYRALREIQGIVLGQAGTTLEMGARGTSNTEGMPEGYMPEGEAMTLPAEEKKPAEVVFAEPIGGTGAAPPPGMSAQVAEQQRLAREKAAKQTAAADENKLSQAERSLAGGLGIPEGRFETRREDIRKLLGGMKAGSGPYWEIPFETNTSRSTGKVTRTPIEGAKPRLTADGRAFRDKIAKGTAIVGKVSGEVSRKIETSLAAFASQDKNDKAQRNGWLETVHQAIRDEGIPDPSAMELARTYWDNHFKKNLP